MGTVKDLQEAQRQRDRRGGHPRSGDGAERDHEAPGHEQMTEDEEKARIAFEAKQREEAIKALDRAPGGTKATVLELQITGPAVELPPETFSRFEKDQEVAIDVAGIGIRAWVKTIKDTTAKKGGHAIKTIVLTVEESENAAQMRIGEDE